MVRLRRRFQNVDAEYCFPIGGYGARPALSGLEEFDGDLFTPDVGQLVRTELNRKGSCLR
jgi:hypothetical protein